MRCGAGSPISRSTTSTKSECRQEPIPLGGIVRAKHGFSARSGTSTRERISPSARRLRSANCSRRRPQPCSTVSRPAYSTAMTTRAAHVLRGAAWNGLTEAAVMFRRTSTGPHGCGITRTSQPGIDIIRHPHTEAEMRWARWTDWQRGDQRWHVEIIDTSGSATSELADAVSRWIRLERSSGRARTKVSQT